MGNSYRVDSPPLKGNHTITRALGSLIDRYSEEDRECASQGSYRQHALERARIFRRLRLSLRDLFFFHFSLML
jgi:hypothetical protein